MKEQTQEELEVEVVRIHNKLNSLKKDPTYLHVLYQIEALENRLEELDELISNPS